MTTDPVAAFERTASDCCHGPLRPCCASAGIAAAIRDLAAVLVDDDRLEPTGHDDLCTYGPPGECDCCRGQHYRWLIAQAEQLGGPGSATRAPGDGRP